MLAIVVPFYKITFFEETLASLAAQTNKNFTVYIGDDAAPVAPVDLIKVYEKELKIIYRRFGENLGGTSLTRQWERCIQMTCHEKWLMILGDDDYLSDNYIQEFYNHKEEIERLDIKVVRFASQEIKEPSKELSRLYTNPRLEDATDFFFRKFIKNSARGSLTEQIFRRDAYLKKGFRDFPLGWGADNFAWLEFSDFGKVYGINSAIAYFRISSENISRWEYKREIKLQVRHDYFKILMSEFLNRFKKEHRIPLLLFYEQLVYHTNNATVFYLLNMYSYLVREDNYSLLVPVSRRFFRFHRERLR